MIPAVLITVPETFEQRQEPNSNAVELWKETNAHIRHWETIVFETSKNFFTAVTVAIGAAGAVVAWSTIGISTQRIVVSLFLGAAIFLSIAAIALVLSNENYLNRFYRRRKKLEAQIQQEAFDNAGSGTGGRRFLTGWSMTTLKFSFVLAIALCGVFLRVVWSYEPEKAMLSGARLQGADLSTVSGLSQRDLANACGDARTKLPVGLVLPSCEPSSTAGESNTHASGSGSQPSELKKN
jgi:hypothetical protein